MLGPRDAGPAAAPHTVSSRNFVGSD
jgi:hypothetical protein